MEIWALINETLAASWPMVVLVLVLTFLALFRHEIADLLKRLRKASAGPLALEMEKLPEVKQINADRNRQLLTAAESVAHRSMQRRPDARDAPQFTRAQVEEFVKIAAEAGYETGEVRMFQGEVEPVIGWIDDAPQIEYWQSRRRAHLSNWQLSRIRQLRHEMQELQAQIQNPAAEVTPQQVTALRMRRRALLQELAVLDPLAPELRSNDPNGS
ncbi:hypothetical protein [Jiangella muralis]|uniref:hypothetical protein n=1 Tax=Jiangella muralis TaxID=702383 RepID=UPI00069D4A05|nr:hypothetical protein [Jiangella muralis]